MNKMKIEAVERIESIVGDMNSRIRSDLSFVAGDLDEVNLKDFEKECYNIVIVLKSLNI